MMKARLLRQNALAQKIVLFILGKTTKIYKTKTIKTVTTRLNRSYNISNMYIVIYMKELMKYSSKSWTQLNLLKLLFSLLCTLMAI